MNDPSTTIRATTRQYPVRHWGLRLRIRKDRQYERGFARKADTTIRKWLLRWELRTGRQIARPNVELALPTDLLPRTDVPVLSITWLAVDLPADVRAVTPDLIEQAYRQGGALVIMEYASVW